MTKTIAVASALAIAATALSCGAHHGGNARDTRGAAHPANAAHAARPGAPAAAPNGRALVLGPEASPISFERIARFPEPGWHVPRAIAHAPDGSAVTFLASEAGTDEMALFSFDRAREQASVLLRAKDLAPSSRPRSREEELRRERQRQRIEGITSYAWARRANVLVVPHAGDVFVYAGGRVERLTDTPEPEIDPHVCDDGTKVAFVRGRELLVVNVATKKETKLTTGAVEGVTHGLSDFLAQEELGEPSGFFWSPACDRIAYLEVDERKVEPVPVHGYRAGRSDLMMQRYPRPGGTNATVRLLVVDVVTRRTTAVALPPGGERYLGRFTWTDDGRSLFFQTLSRDQKRRAIVRADPKTGASVAIAEETDAAWIELSPMKHLARSGELLVASDRTGHRHIELRRANDGSVVRVLTEGSWDVTAIVAVDEERGRVLVRGTRDGPLERHLYAVPLAGGPPSRLTKESGVHDATADERGRAWVDVHSSRARMPRADVLVDGERVGELPVRIDDDLASLRIRPPEIVTLRAEGGEPLYGALLRPRNVVAGARHPAIVMVYGGPGAQTVLDAWSPRLFWQHLADRGFFVFQLDNRGSSGRGHAFQRAIHRRLGDVELADQLVGRAWLASIPEVDAARIGIYGHSYGGFMAALAMLAAPKAFAAGVSSAPVTDWRLYDSAYTERYMETPETNADGYARADLPKRAAALEGKLLLVHALMDENVHYANTAVLTDGLVAARKPFELFVFPGERHGYRSPPARAYVHDRIARFFAENL